MIRRMPFACSITKATDTIRLRNTYCFSTATVVTRTRLSVTFERPLPVLLILCSCILVSQNLLDVCRSCLILYILRLITVRTRRTSYYGSFPGFARALKQDLGISFEYWQNRIAEFSDGLGFDCWQGTEQVLVLHTQPAVLCGYRWFCLLG